MNYQIGKQKITEDKLKNMSGTDANALYYATHQGNNKANTMFTNPGSYVETDEKKKPTKEEYDSLVNQIKQIQKNMNETKREIPKLEKPVKSEQKEQKAEKNPDLLDYYTHKDLIEESTNIRNRGLQNRGLSALDQKRLREIDSLLENNDKAVKASKTDNYLVHRDRYNELMKDSQMQKDIDALAMAYSTSEGTRGRGVRALQTMGYRNSKEYAESLAKKYGLTKEQIDDIVKTYTSDKTNQQTQELGRKSVEFADKHPVLGTVGSALLGTTGSAVEGAYNALAGLTNDDRNISRTFNTLKGGLREGAYVIPWIKTKISAQDMETIVFWVRFAVRCADQLFTPEQWEEKKDYVLNYIIDMAGRIGLKLTEKDINVLIESAVNEIHHGGQA